jgi:DNA-binding transcriptional regulator YiaG
MSKKLSFKEALGRRGATRAQSRAGSDFPPSNFRLVPGKITQPVEIARLLARCGLSLRKAHATLNRLTEGEQVTVELRPEDGERAEAEFSSLGVRAARIHPLRHLDVRQVRELFGISQAEFAARFGLELDTIQNWEQGRYKPDPAAQLLLRIIQMRPDVVEQALTSGLSGDVPGLHSSDD